MILTDAGSWLLPWIEELAEEWAAAGHACHIGYALADCHPGDFCFCLSFGQIVPAATRAHFHHTLVVHESDLPQGRGWAPMTWQILAGASRIPVTLLEAVDQVDAGPIYLQEWIELDGTELNPEWRAHQAQATQRLCSQWLVSYPDILQSARPQVGTGSIYPRRRPRDSELNPNKTLAEQFDLFRVVDNERYPAHFYVRGRKYTLAIECGE